MDRTNRYNNTFFQALLKTDMAHSGVLKSQRLLHWEWEGAFGSSSSASGDLAWETNGGQLKSGADQSLWSVDWWLARCQFTSWALPRCPGAWSLNTDCAWLWQPHRSNISKQQLHVCGSCVCTCIFMASVCVWKIYVEWSNWICPQGIHKVTSSLEGSSFSAWYLTSASLVIHCMKQACL